MKNSLRVFIGVVASLLLVAGFGAPAQAAYRNIGCNVAINGQLHYCPDVQFHSGGGMNIAPVSVNTCGGSISLGMRNANTGFQMTNSVTWNWLPYNVRTLSNPASGSTSLPAASYAMNARVTGVCGEPLGTYLIASFGYNL